MPIYEFRCPSCRERISLFFRSIPQTLEPACPHCARPLERVISSFAYHRSEKDRAEAAGSPDNPGPDYYQDPRNIGRWAEKRLTEMGEEMPDSVREMIGQAREGEVDKLLDKRGLD